MCRLAQLSSHTYDGGLTTQFDRLENPGNSVTSLYVWRRQGRQTTSYLGRKVTKMLCNSCVSLANSGEWSDVSPTTTQRRGLTIVNKDNP